MPTDRSVLVRLKANTGDFVSGMRVAKAAVGDLRNEIDTTNDRTAWLAQGILAIGPTLSPIGAAAVPVFSGLVTQLTLAAGAAGVMVAGFQGIGDALKSVNEYELEPTADNLNKMRLAMEEIGPDGERFVSFLNEIGPQFEELQMLSRAGMFPGMEDGIRSLLTLMPQLERITTEVAEAIGELSEDAGKGLSGPRFAEFFDYIETSAKPILLEMGRTVGNFVDGLGAMIVAFGPLTAQFSSGFESMSKSFADWAHGLDSSASFAEFVSYVQSSIPMVLDLIASLSDAFVAIVVAAAPVGDVMVPALSALFDVITQLAGSPLGPIFIGAAAAMSLYGRAAALASITTGGLFGTLTKGTAAFKAFGGAAQAVRTDAAKGGASLGQFGTVLYNAGQSAEHASKKTLDARAAVRQLGPAFGQAAAGAGLFALAMTDVDDQIGLSGAAMGTLAGFMLAGPWGAAIGGGIGLTRDFAATNNDLTDSLDALEGSLSRASVNMSALDASNLSSQVEVARGKLVDLADTLNNPSIGNFESILAGAKNAIEGLFGSSDYEEAHARFVAAQEEAAAAIVAAKNAAAQAAGQTAYRNMLEAETAALQKNIDAMRTKRSEALRGANASLDYASAVLDAKDAVDENGKTLDKNTREGLANRRALLSLAAAWNGQSDAAKNSTGAHRQARETFIQVARQMGMNAEQAKRYADRLMEIPPKRETKIVAETSVAMQKIAAINSELASIDRTIDVFVNVRKPNAGGYGPQVGGSADGGTVPKSGLPYADRYPYMLADGEEVISNRRGQADRFRPLLKAINNAADGATVGRSGAGSAISLGLPTLEVERFARATEQSRKGLLAELRVRSSMLTKELEANKSRLDALKSERDSIAATVKARLDSDIFARDEREYMQLARPENWNELSPEAQRSHLEAEWSVNQSLGFGQSQSPEDRMRAQQAEAKRMLELIRSLKANGLNGSALAALLAEGDDAQLALYASDKGASRRYERMYNQTERLTSRVGDAAGNAAYGRAITEQTAEVRELRKEAQQTNRRLERIEKATSQTGPDRTAQGVARAINGAAAAGQRKRRLS